MVDTAREARMNSEASFSCGLRYMNTPVPADQRRYFKPETTLQNKGSTYIAVLIVAFFLSCPDDIPDNLVFHIPDESTVKHVTELKFIIRPIYLGWLGESDRRVIIIKKYQQQV